MKYYKGQKKIKAAVTQFEINNKEYREKNFLKEFHSGIENNISVKGLSKKKKKKFPDRKISNEELNTSNTGLVFSLKLDF